MYVRRLSLTNFRCYRQLELTLPCSSIVVSGRNAQGKSSLLEAVYVLATTRSPMVSSDRELINWDVAEDVMPYSRVWGEIARAGGDDTVEVVNVCQPVDGAESRLVKRARVNGAARRAFDVIGTLNVVLFAPRDLQIVDGSPSERRRYLDVLRCQVDRDYCRALARYNKVLTQRNHLLRRLRDRGGDETELRFWDERLARDGALIIERRAETVTALTELAGASHRALAGAGVPLAIVYRSSLAADRRAPGRPAVNTLAATSATAAPPPTPTRAEIEGLFAGRLAERRREEIARGVTSIGPHRDDLAFTVGGIDMRVYGSRGQQRTVTLSLKLAEAQLMWRETGDRPVLLLDDVLSELDADRRDHLLSHIDASQQTLITTTDSRQLPEAFLDGALALTVEDAAITEARQAGKAVRV